MGLTDTSVLVEKYINTSYDIVKTVYDNIADVQLVADDITAVANVAALGSVASITADLTLFLATPPIGIKAPVVVSTTADISLANEQTINTVAVVALDRVLVRSQTDTTENGIYDVVDSGAWTRSIDWNAAADVNSGILVMDGFTEILYKVSFTGIFTPDTTLLTFSPNDSNFTTAIVTTDTTASTSGSTGSIQADGGIGALLDMVTGETFKPLGDTATGDLAALGYDSTNGVIITGQGSTNDAVIKNDVDAIALRVPTGTVNVVGGGTVSNIDSILPFPVGTDMLFYQSAAPTGWTKNTTASLNDHALRIMTSGAWTGGTQGTTVFSTQFAQGFNGEPYTLLVADMPAHTHTNNVPTATLNSASGSSGKHVVASTASGSTGGDGAHQHDVNLGVKYLDMIIASKD